MMRRVLLVLILLFTVVVVVASCGANEEKVINIGYLRVPNDETVAKSMGYIDAYFKDQGVRVNYIIVDSGVEANKAFASKSIDFATMGNTNGIVALSKGLDTELVWIHEVLGSIEALVVKKDLGIQSIEDLKGKKIATTFSSTSHYVLLNALKEAGIEKEVTILDMKTPDIVAAWQRGDIDAAYTWEPSKSKLLELDGEVLIDSEAMAKKGFVTANVGLVRKEFAEKNPELVKGLLTQFSKASKLYKTNPKAAIEAASKEIEISPEEVKNQMAGSLWLSKEEALSSKYFGTSKQRGDFVKQMYDTAVFLKEYDSIEKLPSMEEFESFINPRYIEEINE